ncbi:MAG: hypothetical protein AUI14_18975 [Actinobacteria bacterium 13_2_20CM_2_71_6]|nr:MAG: hypothetical protein AUI14_18975 [Actinobacteria bacterium 13_2_20CM_2_71_6]
MRSCTVLAIRRTLASLGAWTLGAGVAVGVGVLALSLIDNGLASGAGQPMSPDAAAPLPRIEASATATTSVPADPAPADPAPASSSASHQASAAASMSASAGPPRQLQSNGGTVIARCMSSQAYLVSWSPAQGYQVDDVRRGPARTAYATFVAGKQRVILAVRCVAGVPQSVPNWDE